MSDEKKVDEDWKRRAQEEKEKLAQKFAASGPPKIEVPPGVMRERPRPEPPPPAQGGGGRGGPAAGSGAPAASGPATRGPVTKGPPPRDAAQEPPPSDEEADYAAAGAGAQSGRGALPEANFNTFVASLAAQALMSMGQIEHPETGQRYLDLDQARYTIDTIVMLRSKTRGNLGAEEADHLDSILSELQMVFVKIANRMGGRQ